MIPFRISDKTAFFKNKLMQKNAKKSSLVNFITKIDDIILVG